jgi:hypothetical protein
MRGEPEVNQFKKKEQKVSFFSLSLSHSTLLIVLNLLQCHC